MQTNSSVHPPQSHSTKDGSFTCAYLFKPIPFGKEAKCRLVRCKHSGTFELYLESRECFDEADGGALNSSLLPNPSSPPPPSPNNAASTLLLVAKKTASNKYTIYTSQGEGERTKLATVTGNWWQTEWRIVAAGNRDLLARIKFKVNLFGWKGPRQLSLHLPAIADGQDECAGKETRSKRPSVPEFIKLPNKVPTWSAHHQTHLLSFPSPLIRLPSTKNHQIIHAQDPDMVIMQMGKMCEDHFVLDWRYPMSAVQAFGAALCSFGGKYLCE